MPHARQGPFFGLKRQYCWSLRPSFTKESIDLDGRDALALTCIVRAISSNGSPTRSRRVGATRYDKREASYVAFIKLAAMVAF